jgi:hypothetical protein
LLRLPALVTDKLKSFFIEIRQLEIDDVLLQFSIKLFTRRFPSINCDFATLVGLHRKSLRLPQTDARVWNKGITLCAPRGKDKQPGTAR